MGQFIVKALICAVYCQKASVCKHAVIQAQICLWRSALNQMASRLYVAKGGAGKKGPGQNCSKMMLVPAYFVIYQSSNWWGIGLLYHLGSTPYCLYSLIIIACVLKSSVRALHFYSSTSGCWTAVLMTSLSCIEHDAVCGGLLYWGLEALETTDSKLEEKSEKIPLFHVGFGAVSEAQRKTHS